MVGGELLPNGRPAYRNVVVYVPRQSGKTSLLLGWEIQRAVGWDGPQRIAYSAQTGKDSREKLVNDQFPILEPLAKLLRIRQCNRGVGNEGVVWDNGSRLLCLASAPESGHGKTLDLAIRDEFFADADDRRAQAFVPAMATRTKAQVVTASTAGTDASVPLNALVRRGRAAVEEGRRTGIAFFEWSAPDDAEVSDPATWYACMPALGYTIDESVVRDALDTMPTSEFMRAWLNIPTRSETERVWSAAVWHSVCYDDASPHGFCAVGVDATPDRSAASIAIAGGGAIEIATTERLARLPVRIGELAADVIRIARKLGAPVALDPSGPAAYILPALEDAEIELLKVAGQTMGQACGALYTAVEERTVRVRTNVDLNAAVAAAETATRGDVWVWGRRSTAADISPLVAATLAYWGAQLVKDDTYEGSFVGLEDFGADD